MSEPTPGGGRLFLGLGLAALATAGSVGASRGVYEFLQAQARVARRIIPKPTTWPFNGDGIYLPGVAEPKSWIPGGSADIHLAVFGDSLAAGLGASSRAELPAVLVAKGVAEESGRSVRLSTKAIVGASSKSLFSQVEAMQIAGGTPDVALILIGGNDVTAKNGIAHSARRLGEAVRVLVDSGSRVVVGTCPDLGVIRPVPQPLRTVMHSWSLRLADAQAAQVHANGGVPVSLAETLAPELMARPEALFSPDQFHPNSAGYELAAALLLPPVCVALGVWPEEGAADHVEAAQDADDVAAEGSETAEVDVIKREEGAEASPAEGEAKRADGTVVAQLLGRLATFRRQHDADETPRDGGEARRAENRFSRASRFRKRGAAASAEAEAPGADSPPQGSQPPSGHA